jgi:hypothetical protein
MANDFSKEERVMFEDILQGFQDQLVLSKNVNIYRPDQQMMERAGDVVWRPEPYIMQTFEGFDQTANFKDVTQLSVPVSINRNRSSPWIMSPRELRDAVQEGRIKESAIQRLASDINVAMLNAAAMLGSLFVKRPAAAAGYDDVAQCDSIMNEQGVPNYDRCLALSTRDYNGMANNLAARQHMGDKVTKAYERSYVGMIAGFDTYKLDYSRRITAQAALALVVNTLAGGGNVYVPQATSVAATGETSNVDNRFQQITIAGVQAAGVVAGDAFTIATVEAVHHITKQGTGNLKTFRIVSIDGANTATICPPLITGQGGTDPELQYQNCIVNTPAANSAIVWLNTATAAANPFWQKEALEIIPGRWSLPNDAGASIIRGVTEQGLEVIMQKQYDIRPGQVFLRVDTLFGVANKQPEMSGIMMFSQP